MAGRGGRRPGAGRPRGTGKYGEPTKAVRVPEGMVPVLPEYIDHWQSNRTEEGGLANLPSNGSLANGSSPGLTALKGGLRVPRRSSSDEVVFLASLDDRPSSRPLEWVESLVAAGLTVPGDDYEGRADVDLNTHLSRHPSTTFVVKVTGESMIEAGIAPGNLLVVDRQEEPINGRIVVAMVDGMMTVKRLQIMDNRLFLKAENPDRDNPDYRPIAISEAHQFEIIGVVVSVIQQLYK